MPNATYMFKVYRLTSSDYSIPKGSFCLLEELHVGLENSYTARWLPPLFNLRTGPILEKDLELVGELGIPATLLMDTHDDRSE